MPAEVHALDHHVVAGSLEMHEVGLGERATVRALHAPVADLPRFRRGARQGAGHRGVAALQRAPGEVAVTAP